jgi:hypothetical protein
MCVQIVEQNFGMREDVVFAQDVRGVSANTPSIFLFTVIPID